MCEANVYWLNDEGEEQLLLEAVDKIIPGENQLYLEDIFGHRKTVKAKIKEMELVNHRIIIEKLIDE